MHDWSGGRICCYLRVEKGILADPMGAADLGEYEVPVRLYHVLGRRKKLLFVKSFKRLVPEVKTAPADMGMRKSLPHFFRSFPLGMGRRHKYYLFFVMQVCFVSAFQLYSQRNNL